MTTNQERAQQIIAKWIDDNLPYSEGNVWADEAIAEALADAGLLMQDLPMAEEVEYRIVPADSNGGKYETRRWTRHVTEWAPDAAS